MVAVKKITLRKKKFSVKHVIEINSYQKQNYKFKFSTEKYSRIVTMILICLIEFLIGIIKYSSGHKFLKIDKK
jgi:hypothetical protein